MSGTKDKAAERKSRTGARFPVLRWVALLFLLPGLLYVAWVFSQLGDIEERNLRILGRSADDIAKALEVARTNVATLDSKFSAIALRRLDERQPYLSLDPKHNEADLEKLQKLDRLYESTEPKEWPEFPLEVFYETDPIRLSLQVERIPVHELEALLKSAKEANDKRAKEIEKAIEAKKDAIDSLGAMLEPTAEWEEPWRGLNDRQLVEERRDPERSHPHARKFWRHQDVADLLDRWGRHLPADHVHLVTVPQPGAPRDLLWRRFCEVVGVDPDVAELPGTGSNVSLGVTAVDVLRRVNGRLRRLDNRPPGLRRTVKQVLVNGALRADESPRVSAPDALLPRLQEITDEWVRRVREAGYRVVGDLDDLTPRPATGDAPARPRVQVRESRDLAVDAVAVLTREIAVLRDEVREVEALRRRVAELESGAPARVMTTLRRLRAGREG